MRAARALITASLLVAPLPAAGVELLTGWDSRGVWTSNVFRSAEDEQDAFSLLNGPNLGLRQRTGDVRFEVEYSPRYEFFPTISDANALEHYAMAYGSWSIDRRTEVSLYNRFSESRGLREVFDPTGPDPEVGEVFVDRKKTLRNAGSGSVSRWLTPRTQLVMNLSQQYFNYEDEDQPDALSFRGGPSLRYVLTKRQTAGFGFAVNRQESLETNFQQQSGTTFYESFVIYDVVLSRTLKFALSGGPTMVVPDDFDSNQVLAQYATTSIGTSAGRIPVLASRASCANDEPPCGAPAPAFDANTGAPIVIAPVASIPVVSVPFVGGAPTIDSSLTFYGSAVLSYDRKPFAGQLAYTRRASNTSGLGNSTNIDIATLAGNWAPARRWRLGARLSWQRQTSASEFPLTQAVLAPDGATVLLGPNLSPVTNPADATIRVEDVAQFVGVRTSELVDNAVDVTTYTVDLRAVHELTRRLRLEALASYWYQETGGDFASDTQRESFRVELGVSWSFDPISL